MTDQTQAFLQAMREAGCAPATAEILADDKLYRYQIDGDKPKSLNGAYRVKVEPDGFAVGWFKDWRTGQRHPWHSKTSRKATAEEKAEVKRRIDRMRLDREAVEAEEKRLAAEKAVRIWGEAGKLTGQEKYLVRKMVGTEGAKSYREAIVIPVRKGDNLVGLQFIAPDGSKRFLTGSDIEGSYCSLAKRGDDLSTIAIGEGWATCASVRMATGWPVIVAFNAGNLKPVAKVIRAKYPDARIVILADNDQWAQVKGKPVNPGREAADQAAVAIGGAQVVWPFIPADDYSKRTDWNDIHVSDGLDAVKAGVMAAPVVAMLKPEVAPDWVPDDRYDLGQSEDRIDPLEAIRPLGHEKGIYYFLPKAGGQIVEVSATALGRIQTLYRLATRSFWEIHYGADGKTSDSDIASYASAHLIEACHREGVFRADKVRGVGAWIDGGKVIVNCGDVIVSSKGKSNPSDFKGKYLYEAGSSVIDLDCEPLGNREASKLRDVCRMLKWKRPQYADLLAGWLVLAAVGSALKWRPHIVITGPKGCGKSTVMEDVVKSALGDIAINGDGGTTEAGVRKVLGVSGRPFIMDEAESESKRTQGAMADIFFLARRASSGGKVINAYKDFCVRSCFCFAAINPRIEQGADKDRITTLELVVDKSSKREANYSALLGAISDCMSDGFSNRLMARTIKNMDAIFHNIGVFGSVASEILGDKRSGDQVGPMIAGAYSLVSTGKVTLDFAREWMAKQQWEWYSTDNDLTDAERLVAHIMTSRIRYDHDGRGLESSVGELISRAADPVSIGHLEASKGLRGYGVKIEDHRLLIANNSPQLKRLLDDTPWGVWRRTLADYPGADGYDNKSIYFGPAFTSKVCSLPLDAVLGHVNPVQEEEVGFGDDYA